MPAPRLRIPGLLVALLCLAFGCSSTKDWDAGICDASSLDWSADSPVDVPPPDASPEAGATYEAPDASIGPDAPATPTDGTSLPNTPEAGRACTYGCDDGIACTTDTCAGGICQNTLNPGYCLIDKTCYTDCDTKPGDTCQACLTTTSTSDWSPEPEDSRCGTGKSCQSGVCRVCGVVGHACCGTVKPGTCVEGATCNTNTNQCQADRAIDISGTNDTVCALLESGRVRCWGTSGIMLGATTGSNVAAPPVAGLEDAVSISVGSGVVCAVRATGAVACWGSSLPGGGSSALPLPISKITNARQVSAGPHTCVLTADGKVMCWGDNSCGQFGDGTTSTTANSVPAEMPGVADAVGVAACGGATCVIHKGGQVSCTGAAYENGLTRSVSTMADIPGLATADSLSCLASAGTSGRGDFCVGTQMGTLVCWSSSTPAAVPGLGQVAKATSSGANSGDYFAIQSDGCVWALGTNAFGQLGDGTFTNASIHTSPRLIHDASPVGKVVAMTDNLDSFGYQSTCLLRTDGSVSCAGRSPNDAGGGTTLGDGQQYPQAPRAYFVPVVGILPVASEDGQCYDGVDNDGDGKTDLDDSDCAQDLGTTTGPAVATGSFAGVFGNYLQESCNKSETSRYGGPEVVLTWTAPEGGTYEFDTRGSTFDTVLAVYTGNPLTSCTELACNDDDDSLSNGASAAQVQVASGEKLTLVVDSKVAPTEPASFTVNITKM